MYRRLFTQSRVYTWGNTSYGRLGHSSEVPYNEAPAPRHWVTSNCPRPVELEDARKLGVIADMQCG